jgi:DNA replication protein DnaC
MMLNNRTFRDVYNRVIKNIPRDTDDQYKKMLEELEENEIKILVNKSCLPLVATQNKTIIPVTKAQATLLSKLTTLDVPNEIKLPYIYGPPGTGKSFVSARLGYKIIKKNKVEVKFISVPEFLIKLRSDKTLESYLDNFLHPYVLILDDLFSHNINPQSTELIHSVLDYRLRNKKRTMITSNVSPNKIASFLSKAGRAIGVPRSLCDAIQDRVFELCTLEELRSESLRVKMATTKIK